MLTGIAAAFFYLFAFIMIASAFMVIAARNPVHSVLFLILTFFNAAALFLLTGAEFLAMILLVVYVGAVAVLFLFAVMILDVDSPELKRGLHRSWGRAPCRSRISPSGAIPLLWVTFSTPTSSSTSRLLVSSFWSR